MRNFRFRAKILLALLALWGALASFKLFYYTVYARQKYLRMGSRLAWREGGIPAGRGRILDKNKVPLAWNEKFFDLWLADKVPAYCEKELLMRLKEIFPSLGDKTLNLSNTSKALIKNLTPEQILSLNDLLNAYPFLKIMPRVERRRIDYPEIKRFLGETSQKDGMITGVSGIEAKFNDKLSGQEGAYIVMLDSKGRWIRGTWTLLKKPEPGSDLTLEKSYGELLKEPEDDK